VVLSLLGCSDYGSPGYGSGGAVPVDGVRLAPQVLTFSVIGDTMRLVATVSPANATDRAVRWESTDSAVASVDSAGLVTANAAGSAVFITVFTHDGNFQASANVTVGP